MSESCWDPFLQGWANLSSITGSLEVSGRDEINVKYSDEHTADGKLNQSRLRKLTVVGNAVARVMDGAFVDPIEGVVGEAGQRGNHRRGSGSDRRC